MQVLIADAPPHGLEPCLGTKRFNRPRTQQPEQCTVLLLNAWRLEAHFGCLGFGGSVLGCAC